MAAATYCGKEVMIYDIKKKKIINKIKGNFQNILDILIIKNYYILGCLKKVVFCQINNWNRTLRQFNCKYY